jgi:hypothetical protein
LSSEIEKAVRCSGKVKVSPDDDLIRSKHVAEVKIYKDVTTQHIKSLQAWEVAPSRLTQQIRSLKSIIHSKKRNSCARQTPETLEKNVTL